MVLTTDPRKSMDDLVFEGRNKVYGAYQLRRMYGRNMTRGMITGILLFLLGISTPKIMSVINGMMPREEEILITTEVFLSEKPEIEEAKPVPPPPAKSAPPTSRPQIQYVSPVVRTDDEVSAEEPLPPTIDEIENNEISTVTEQGVPDGVDVSLIEPDAPVGDPVISEPEEEKIFHYVEQMPSFPGGQAAMYKYLSDHIKYPSVARDNRIEGNVVVQFVVSIEGEITTIKIVRGLPGGIDQEATRVIKNMPRWNPGKHNGRTVPVTFTLPIKFELMD